MPFDALYWVAPDGVPADAAGFPLESMGCVIHGPLNSIPEEPDPLMHPRPAAVLLGPIEADARHWEAAALERAEASQWPVIAFGTCLSGLSRLVASQKACVVVPLPVTPDAFKVMIQAAVMQFKRAERVKGELATSLALKRAILRETPAVVYAKDENMRFLLSNKQHAELVGRPPEDILGLTDVDLFGEEGLAIEAVSRQVMQTGEYQSSEFELPMPDGNRFFHEVIFPIRADSGLVIGVAGIATDQTEVRQQQMMLEKLRATFQIMLDASPIALLLVERDGRVAMANVTACQLAERPSLVGANFQALVGPFDGPRLEQHALDCASVPVDVQLTLPDAGLRPLELRASSVELPDGRATLVSWVDLTQRKMAEDRMREAQQHAEVAAKAKGAFLAHMSHEIRTPMNAVLGFAQLLERDSTLSPVQLERVRTILRAGDHLLTLVNQVLDMSVIEAGRVDIQRELVNTEDLVDSVLEMFQARAAQGRLWLRSEMGPSLPRAFVGDEGKIRQILVNLVGNAVRVVQQGGVTLRVEVVEAGSFGTRLRMAVSDTGPGIPPADLERIFGAFEQAGSASLRGGAGLGLSISHRYAELMGGRLLVDSTLEQGTTFILDLPLEGAVGELASPPPQVAEPRRGRTLGRRPRLLVVDDEVDNRDLLVQMLDSDGFNVACAEEGMAAIGAVQADAFDAIVMDYRMPGMDGLEVTHHLRQMEPPFLGPIIILTASVFDGLNERAIKAGANRYLRKPVKHLELLEAVCDLLDIDAPEPLDASHPGGVGATDDGVPPPEIVAAFREAVTQFDYGRLMALSESVATTYPHLAQVAIAAASSFDYQALTALLDEAAAAG